jgi:Asp/Glu/hydantoin racemase
MNAARVGQFHRIALDDWHYDELAPSLGSSPRCGLPWQARRRHLGSRLKYQHLSRQEAFQIKCSPVDELGQIETRVVNHRWQRWGEIKMRVVMIHAVAESMQPTKLAFQEVFPEAELVNLLDEGLFLDFGDQLTPELRRRMTQLICYSAEHGAQAIGLACSVYTPMVEMARGVVDVPVVSSYGSVMAEAVQAGRRVGLIASVPATLRDAGYFLQHVAREYGKLVETYPRLAEDLMTVKRHEGEAVFCRRLAEEVDKLAPHVDAVLLTQFSMASSLSHLRTSTSVPVLSPPHSSARLLKDLLLPSWHP